MQHSPVLLGLAVAAYVFKIFVVAIYNLWFHPLSPVPGPFIAKISSAYLARAQVQLRKAQALASLHARYGPIVRVGINEVSISDWATYKRIYGPKCSTKTDEFYGAAIFLGHDNVFSMRDKAQHNGRRKMQAQPYSQQAIMANEALIASKADTIVQRMISQSRMSASGATVDLYPLCGLFSLEVILKCAFNRDYGEAVDSWSAKLLAAMDASAATMVINVHLPFLKSLGLGRYVPGKVGHMYRQFDIWVSLTMTLLSDFEKQKAATDKSQRFMATPLLTNRDEFLGRNLTREEAVEEIMGITFAGSGTTSTTLAFLIYALSRPDAEGIQGRLREELCSAPGSLTELRKLPYLDAVIKETMLRPKGTRVGMQNYVHHRDPGLFPEPEKFLPQRWLGENAKSRDMNSALTPFSVGPRDCIGQNLARAELFLATSKIFRRFKTTLNASMTEDDMVMEDRFNLAPKGRKILLDVQEVI